MKKNIVTSSSTIIDCEEIVDLMNVLLPPYRLEKRNDPDLRWLYPAIKHSIVDATLQHTRGNQAKAARMLGINRFTLRSIYTQKNGLARLVRILMCFRNWC